MIFHFTVASSFRFFRALVWRGSLFCLLTLTIMATITGAFAQVIPPSATDPGRVEKRMPPMTSSPLLSVAPSVTIAPTLQAPEGMDRFLLILKRMEIRGMTAFTEEQMRDIYAPYLGRQVTLDIVWAMTGRITERYHQAGYLLSRAYMPQQKIVHGVVVIQVVEGHIGELDLDEKAQSNDLLTRWLDPLLAMKPLTLTALESTLLRINDLPDANYRAVLEKIERSDAQEGAVRLRILTSREAPHAVISFDNNGSRYLGPYQLSQRFSGALLSNQTTSFNLLSSSDAQELFYGSLSHRIPITYRTSIDVAIGQTRTTPGYTLKPQAIDGISTSYEMGFTQQWVRQRQQNFYTRLAYDARDTTTDLLDHAAPLTRDHVRALRLSWDYQLADTWGVNLVHGVLSRGIDGFGASKAGSANLSRAQATPNFTKWETDFTRKQPLTDHWQSIFSFQGQLASGPLFSSEEFGYGGQRFGRAYDSSEITGEHGLSGSIEFQYTGFPPWKAGMAIPYGFYDAGMVWNDDTGQTDPATGSSAGFGIRASTEKGLAGDLGVAFPLTRNIATPIQGNSSGPRILMQFSYDF